MSHGPVGGSTELPIHVTDDGRVFVHVGTRFVEASIDDVDRILDRLATEGGAVVYSRDDPGEEPHPIALDVMELVARHRLPIRLLETMPDELGDADL